MDEGYFKFLNSDTHSHNKRYWCNQCLCVSLNLQDKLNEDFNVV